MSWEPEDIAAYKDSRRDTQTLVERHRRKGQRANPSRKTLLDRLAAARSSLLMYIEWKMDSRHSRWWWQSNKKWAARQYAKALQACWDAGIKVKA